MGRGGTQGRRVVVRWARVDDGPLDHALLADDARRRAAGFRHDVDRRLFVGVRLLLIQALVELLDCAPGDVVLRQVCSRCGGPHGRPVVDVGSRRGVHVSLAHSGELAMVAIASRAVGVDVEAAPQPGAAHVDLVDWVRREAILKATGHGFLVDSELVGLGPSTSPPRLVRWDGPGARPRLRIADLDLGADHTAAVALAGLLPLRVDAAQLTLG